MSGPKISIIVPCYNEEKNIGRLLDSINGQTYKNIESIVVDSSRDKTAKIAKDKGAIVVKFRKRTERSIQRNAGAKKAKGKYLVFLDADMELSPKVIESCVKTISGSKYKALVIPEKTVGNNYLNKIRAFEREMYEGDLSIEVARFFERKVFNEFKGYDEKITGAEDYDLPKRISSKYKIGRSKRYIFHHEEALDLWTQLKKKYYYASKSAIYAKKHPDLVATQGNLLFRKAYFRNWRKFLNSPVLGISFIVVRVLEASAAVLGYISAVGVVEFAKTFVSMFKK